MFDSGEIEDYTLTGLSDLREGVVRTPLDPFITFRDDPLRILRAVRFTARFNFRMEERMVAAIRDRDIQVLAMGARGVRVIQVGPHTHAARVLIGGETARFGAEGQPGARWQGA